MASHYAMLRRDFLKNAGCFVATASLTGLASCGDDDDHTQQPKDAGDSDAGTDAGTPGPGLYAFLHGVASGDPQPDSVMFWTRVQAKDAKSADPIALRLELSKSDKFDKLVLHRAIKAGPDSDFTVRVLVDGLEPDTIYFYRFVAGADESRTGRTWTAPKTDSDVPIQFAWVCCQDYGAGFYGAYRRMLNQDEGADEAEQLRFVMHIGDFIYETLGQEFQAALDEDLEPIELKSKAGKPRVLPKFPAGGGKLETGGQYAKSVDDYRHLYKSFLLDADLQDARARWPFVSVWDDHEFTDDCWQTQANYTNDKSFDEPSQKRRVAASQAWFEYVPALLSDAASDGDVENQAQDFEPIKVEDMAYMDPVDVSEPNNQKAIDAVTIYRHLQFGKHVDIVLTDNRSYRSDHALAEEVTAGNPFVFHPRAGLPIVAVNAFDAGRDANGGMPQKTVGGFKNTRMDQPPGTVLGSTQKKWWKDVMRSSQASFKVWGNSVPLLRLKLDVTAAPIFIAGDLVLSADGWDGYPSERRELMGFLKSEGIRNVVSLSGDHHAHYAGLVFDDFDADAPVAVMADFCTAAISSGSQFAEIAGAITDKLGPNPGPDLQNVANLITFDATKYDGGTRKAAPNLNTLLRYGSASAKALAETYDIDMVAAMRNEKVNPHLRYVDSTANGYGLARFDGDGAKLTLVTIEPPLVDRGEDGAMLRSTADFTLAHFDSGDKVVLDAPELSGDKPFPDDV
jgi:alkaline phosphatase D